MSITPEGAGSFANDGPSDADWDAAMAGTYTGVSTADPPERTQTLDAPQPTHQPSPAAPAQPQAAQFNPLAQEAPPARETQQAPPPQQGGEQAPFQWPTDVAPLLQNLPPEFRNNPAQVIQAARQYLSTRGNFPQIEQRWRQQHVEPIAAELAQTKERLEYYESERRAAAQHFIDYDPNTGQARTPQQREAARAYVEQKLAEEEAARSNRQQATQREQDIALREQAVQQGLQQNEQALQGIARMGAALSIPTYKQRLAQHFQIPKSEIDAYASDQQLLQELQTMPNLSAWNGRMQELLNFASWRAQNRTQDLAAQANANGRYRDVGGATGSGGQPSGNRWELASENDFDTAWERSKQGNYI